MTDRELMKQELEALEVALKKNIAALRERLAQPYCDDCGGTDPECPLTRPATREEKIVRPGVYEVRSCAECGKSGGWALYCVECMEKLVQPKRDGACRHCDGTGCVACDARHLPEQEPVAMRMPKEGDRVICIEDDSVGTVLFTSAAGGPYVKFDDGSYGQWSLREFGAGFRYANTTSPRREWVGLTEEERSYYLQTASNIGWWKAAEIIEAKLKEKNT